MTSVDDGLTWDPSSYLRETQPDVQVIETDALPERTLGGVDHGRRIIWLAEGLGDAQRRSTLAFEVGCLLQGPTPADPVVAVAKEWAAKDWASLMLIPSADLMFAFRLSLDLEEIAAHLGVDLQMLRARLRGLSDAEQDEWMQALQSRLNG